MLGQSSEGGDKPSSFDLALETLEVRLGALVLGRMFEDYDKPVDVGEGECPESCAQGRISIRS